MKKTSLLVVFALISTMFYSAQAQNVLKNKNGKVMLPEEGDWSISAEANEFIKFAADLAHIGGSSAATPPTFKGNNDNINTYSITGKRFTSATQAERFSVRVFGDNEMMSVYTAPNSGSGDDVKDVMRSRDNMIAVGYGKEFRKGASTSRLQGFYGYEALVAIGSSGTSYKYGNDLEAGFRSSDFNGGEISGDERTTSTTNGLDIALGARGFIGVEYFVVPKISIGGEYGWGIGIHRDFGGKTKSEHVTDGEKESKSGSTGGLFIGNQRKNSTDQTDLWMNSFSPSGNLSINFYF
jgi:hypothetical protein